MKAMHHGVDRVLAEMMDRLPRSFDRFFLAVTRLGDPVFLITVAAIIGIVAFMEHSQRIGVMAFSIPLTLLIGYSLKRIIKRARPRGSRTHMMRLDTFSFPSGHSSGSMITYGVLAVLAWQYLPPILNISGGVVLGALPFVVGVSRVYLKVHYATDVVAGWLLGLLVLLVLAS